MLRDLRYAFRSLRASAGFSLVAVVTLGLGIGASTAVFGLANWLALRPLPGVEDQAHLALVDFHPEALSGVSYPNLADLRERISAFSGMAAFSGTKPIVVHIEGQTPQYVRGTLVSADYFRVLGAQMAVGRGFTAQEEAAAATNLLAVISHRLWTTMFGAEMSAVGRTFTVSGLRAAVVGVAPRDFGGAELQSDQDIWLPGSAFYTLAHVSGGPSDLMLSRGATVFDQIVGRLAPGATLEGLSAQVGAAVTSLAEAYPRDNDRWKKTPPTVLAVTGVPPLAREAVGRTLTLLGAVAGLVLLIACANVGNLLLFRSVARRGETAIRRALGGSNGQLIRSQLGEALLLATAAGVVGLVFGVWLTGLFRGLSFPGALPLARFADVGEVEPHWRVLAFGIGVALVAGLLFGLIPALAATRVDLMAGLRATAARGSAGGGRLRNTLVTLQLAVCAALLVGALLLAATVRNLTRIPLGFDAQRVTSFAIWPPFSGYSRQQSQALLRDALARVRSLPGVEEASLTGYTPFSVSIGDRVRPAGASPSDGGMSVTAARISRGYFRAMGIPLLAGRDFQEEEMFARREPGTEGVAILSASQAMKLFGSRDVVGRSVTTEGPGGPYRIIGVAQDTRWESLTNEGRGAPVYLPLPPYSQGGVLLVRSGLAAGALRTAIQRQIAGVAPSVPVFDIERLSEKVGRSIAQQRVLARLLSAFALLAVGLTGVGLYAVVAFGVAQRTRELGIRIALGARAQQVLGMVLGEGARLGALGFLLGFLGAAVLSRLIASQLYGITPLAPLVYLIAAALLLVLVLVASLLPARRATRADPMAALRAE